MKTKKLLIRVALVCLSVVVFAGCSGNTKTESSETKTLSQEQIIQRGNYLVTTIGCHDCHSPKIMGQQGFELIPHLLLSGYQAGSPLPKIDKGELQNGWLLFTVNLNAAVGPWGVSFAANLTSDQTGIGNWPEENFMRALKQGKYKGIENGRTLLPPMPWQNFSITTDEDLKAIYAFLKSTKPVINVVPLPISPMEIN